MHSAAGTQLEEAEAAHTNSAPGEPSRRATVWILGLILLLALGLRLYGIDWDDGGLFHPDERAILMQTEQIEFPSSGQFDDLLSADESPLNPGWFNYGSLPLYALRTVQGLASPFTDWNLFDLRFPGRVMSALADTVTILLVFAFGAHWYGKRVALLAAALTSLAVIHIQLSHFFAVDTILAMFILATLLVSARLASTGGKRTAAFAGLLFGLAVATKASAAPLVLAVAFAHFIYAFSTPGDRFRFSSEGSKGLRTFVTGGVISGAAALGTLLVAQPYMFLDFDQFWTDITRESEMVRRIVDFPYTRQYEDTPRYLYQAYQLGSWGLGPVLGIAVWTGFAAGVIAAWRSRRKTDLVIMAWVLPYLAITGWFDVKFMRYMLPVTPLLILFGSRTAWGLVDTVTAVGRRLNARVLQQAAAPVVLGLLIIPTAHYALAFESIYARPHPAQSASEWIANNVPQGSTILKEHWDEGLPELYQYNVEELPLYNHDSLTKLNDMSGQLADAEFLVIFSNRLYGTIPRLPDRYPFSTVYYEKLFSGELGYELAYTKDRPAKFLGIGYDADRLSRVDLPAPAGFEDPSGVNISFGWADESFTVYDHTRPMVFRNSGGLSAEEIEDIILTEVGPTTPAVGLLLTDDERAVQVANGTFKDIVDLGPEHAGWSWIAWLFAIQGIGLVTLPIGYVLFRPLPNRGYLLHKPLGLLLVAFLAWLMASTGVMDFSRWSVVFALVLWAAVAAAVGWSVRDELREFLRKRWRMVAGMEILFVAAFLAFLLVRVANPDLWHPWRGGEKPMDFAYLNAVTRSTIMPPYDPWFAGGYLNYYYFGQFIVASMIRLTGIVPSVAYNLAVPTFFAMTIGGAFTVVHGLVERAQLRPGIVSRSATSAVVAGLTGAAFVAVIGNLDGLFQVISGINRVIVNGEPFGDFDFWRSSRMYASDSGGNEITEFPFFSFLFADLHAHMIAIPFAVMTVGLAVAAFLSTTSPPRATPLATIVGLLALSLGVGSLRVINAWDFPTSMGLVTISLVAGELLSKRGSTPARLGRGVGKAVVVGALTVILFLPFHGRYEVEAGVVRNDILSPLWRYLTIYGIFVVALAAYIAIEFRRVIRSGEIFDIAPRWLRNPPLVAAGIVIVFTVLLTAIVATGQATLGFTLAVAVLLMGAWLLAHRRREVDRMELGIATAVAATALGLGAFPEVFSVKDDIVRQNTVFKFYLQAWVLFGIASAYILWRMWALSAPVFAGGRFLTWTGARAIGLTAFAVALGVGMIYPVMATPVRVDDQFNAEGSGLDGAEYMADAVYLDRDVPLTLGHDLKAILWLQSNVEGSPTIIEGLSDLYRWGNRVSIYTGLPAVIGWDWHQRQQRPEYAGAVVRRRFEVDNFYTTRNRPEAADVLSRYAVRYVYVGELERNRYPEHGIAKLDDMETFGLVPVYEDGPVTIYEFHGDTEPVVSR